MVMPISLETSTMLFQRSSESELNGCPRINPIRRWVGIDFVLYRNSVDLHSLTRKRPY